jgi:hypothetical protein
MDLRNAHFSFEILSIPESLILSTAAKFQSFSISCEFRDDNSGQKKMLMPDGRSGLTQRKSQFKRQDEKAEEGWRAILSM